MATRQTAPILRHLRGLVLAETMRCLTDRELLRLFVEACDETAFAVLVQRHGRLVLSVCRHVLRHEQDAEDAFQAVFLVLARKAASIHKADSVASWLYGVAHRTAMKAKTTAARRRTSEKQAEERAAEQPAAVASLRELQALLDEEVLRLPEKYRAPFVLCCLEGKSREEAARELGWKEGTVSSRVAHAREQLRQRLARRGVTLSAALCAGAIAEGANAAVPAALTEATVGGAVAFVAGGASGAIPTSVLALTGGVLKTITISPLKAGLILAIVLSALSVGAGFTVYPTPAKPSVEAKQEAPAQQVSRQPAREEKQSIRIDRHGDPLPEGAITRIGTVRLRHDSWVLSLAFSPGGKELVSASLDRTLAVWDAASGKLLRRIVGHDCDIMGLAFSPDGKTIAAAGIDKTIHLWDFITGKELWQVPGQLDFVFVAFMADGKALITTSGFDTIRRWRAADGKEDGHWQMRDWKITSVVCSPDGKTLALGDQNNKIHLWDTATATERLTIEGHSPALKLAFSPDGRLLASVDREGTCRLWRVETGKEESGWQTHSADKWRRESLAFSPDGKYLAGACENNNIQLWDVATGKEVRVFQDIDELITALRFSPDGKMLASASTDSTIRLWDVETGHNLHPTEGHEGEVNAIAFLPDGKSLASSSLDRTMRIWDLVSGKELRRLQGPEPKQGYLATFATDTAGRIAVGHGKSVRFWDASTDKESREPLALPGTVNHLALSPDGKVLLTRLSGDQIFTWDVTSGEVLSSVTLKGAMLVAFSPRGQPIVISSEGTENPVEWVIRDLGTEKVLGRFKLKQQGRFAPMAYAFSPDGRTMAVSFTSKTIHLTELATGQVRKEFAEHPDFVNSLAFTRDGRTIASACWDRTIHLWDVTSGKAMATRRGAQRYVFGLAFAPDGKMLASSGTDTTILIWEVAAHMHRPISPEQPLEAKELEVLWSDLASDDAKRAGQAIDQLVTRPRQAAAFLKGRLRPVEATDPIVVARLLADLDSADFTVRDQATKELEKLGGRVEAALRKALDGKPSLETARRLKTLLEKLAEPFSSMDNLRLYRALEVLEALDAEDARPLLETLAKGADSWQTREAKASLQRLLQRTAARE